MSATTLDRAEVQRRTLWVLAVGVALSTAGAAAAFAAAAVLGEELTGSEVLGSLAAAGLTIGTAIGAVPLARVMDARGRRVGFRIGLRIAAAGGVLVMISALVELYPPLLAGTLLVGVGNAVALAARFAAADLAPPQLRGRAIGFVVWAATFGAVLGPAAGLAGGGFLAEALGLPRQAGVYAFVAIALLLAAEAAERFLRPDPLLLARELDGRGAGDVRATIGDGLRAIAAAPAARIGVCALVAAHVVMIGIMTVTPLHLHDGGGGLTLIGFVISVHILGMYALSPLAGRLTDRLGAVPMVLAGGVVLIVAAEMAAASDPHDHGRIFGALFLLGLGWNFELVASSAILSTAIAPAQRVAAQGVTDLTMNACGAAAGIGAGFVIGLKSFAALGHIGAAVAVILVVAAAAAAVLARGPRQARFGLDA